MLVAKKIVRNLTIVIMAFMLTVPVTQAIAAYNDYVSYAKQQVQKEQVVIAPYINQLTENKTTAFNSESYKEASEKIVLIFVSFAMPKESLKGWIRQAQKIDAPVYIRGLLDNSFQKTSKAVSELIEDQKGGVLIDPLLFKKHVIKQVPAVVVVNNQDDFDVIYGDVTLDYALEKIAKENKSRNENFLLDIKKLREKSNA